MLASVLSEMRRLVKPICPFEAISMLLDDIIIIYLSFKTKQSV